jgi:hypothetical protein
MSNTGISTNDFTQIYADFKRTVSYRVMTKTTDPTTGDETSTFAVASNQDVIFFLEENRYIFDKEGLLQVGDAYALIPLSINAKRYDQLTIDGSTYYIENTIQRYVLSTEMFTYAVLFKVT